MGKMSELAAEIEQRYFVDRQPISKISESLHLSERAIALYVAEVKRQMLDDMPESAPMTELEINKMAEHYGY